MRIAIVTGASSGMGRLFALTAADHVSFDELWITARREERLEEVRKELGNISVRKIPMDLSLMESPRKIGAMLGEENHEVVLLVNAAGFGKFQTAEAMPLQTADMMAELNCRALMDMCLVCLPYMKRGAKILNIASVAAFQPIPCLAEYAATKAFVLSFSRALWKELKLQGITVTALCPYWTKTEFFDVAEKTGSESPIKYFNAMYRAEDVVRRGWRDLLRGRDLSTFGFIARAQLLLVMLLPHRMVMSVWCRQQKIRM